MTNDDAQAKAAAPENEEYLRKARDAAGASKPTSPNVGIKEELPKALKRFTEHRRLPEPFAGLVELVRARPCTTEAERKQKQDDILRCEVELCEKLCVPPTKSVSESNEKASKSCFGWVISIDIRSSTDLMAAAQDPTEFAEFMGEYTEAVRAIVHRRWGFYDKFTGDGALVFFPDDLLGSPEHTARAALETCVELHREFRSVYARFAHVFHPPYQTGVGIGVDYGEVVLRAIGEIHTVIGRSVVAACRLGNCNAHKTLVSPAGRKQAIEVLAKASAGGPEYLESFARAWFLQDDLPVKNKPDTPLSAFRFEAKEFQGWMDMNPSDQDRSSNSAESDEDDWTPGWFSDLKNELVRPPSHLTA